MVKNRNLDPENEIQRNPLDHLGHRARLRARLLSSRFGSTPDYELLEMALSFAILRGDTKPLAKDLLRKYGSLHRILSLDPNILKLNKGVGDSVVAVLRVIKEVACLITKEVMEENPIIESWSSLIEYCRATMGHIKTEQFRIIYLDSKNMILSDDLQEVGTVDCTPIYPREVTKRALLLDASSIILIHNHPSGNTKPSSADIDATKLLIRALSSIGVNVHDHIIISYKSYFSFRSSGLI